jgi:4-amino-4-deoxy-L-arabinose transferase-like glycosyltransferase
VTTRRTLGLAGLAIVVRVGYWLATLDLSTVSDAHSYHVIARSIAEGVGFSDVYPELGLHPTGFRAPLFPSLLSAPYRVFGTHVGVARATNLVLGVVLVLLVERFASRLGGRTAGLFAAIAVAVYPPLVANDVSVLAETVSLILIVVVGMFVVDDRWVGAGVATGFLVLARNSAQLYAFLVAAVLLRHIGWRRTLAFLGIAFLVVTPWLVRNAIQLGAPVLTTSNGFNVAALYSEEAHQDGDFVDPVFDERFEALRLVQFDELDWDAELRSRGLDGLRAHPLEPLRVARRNLMRHFELKPWENDDPEERDNRSLTIRHVTLPLFYVVTIAGIAGLWVWRRQRGIGFLALTAAYFSLTSIFSVFAPRLRGPFDLVCCIGVGLLVARLRATTGAGPPGSSTREHPEARTP